MPALRVIGDVHAQFGPEDVLKPRARPYCEIAAEAAYSVQIGDMGDAETYDQLARNLEPARHCFFPGNHDDYHHLPPHCLGDFGLVNRGGVEFFFLRGAASFDREKLVRRGKELGRTLWHEQEELSEEQMRLAEEQYVQAKPRIVLTHDAPTAIAEFAWQHAARSRRSQPQPVFRPSRTNEFLTRLHQLHQPEFWVFGHHHHDWSYRELETRFVCLGELSWMDIDANGDSIESVNATSK